MSKTTAEVVHIPEVIREVPVIPLNLSARAEQEITELIQSGGQPRPVSTTLTHKQPHELTPIKVTKALLTEALSRYVATLHVTTHPQADFGGWILDTFYAGNIFAYRNSAPTKTNSVKLIADHLTGHGYPCKDADLHKIVRGGIVWRACGDDPRRDRLTFSHLVALYPLVKDHKVSLAVEKVVTPKRLMTRDETTRVVSDLRGTTGKRTKQNAAKAAEGESQEGGESGSEGHGVEEPTPVQAIARDIAAVMEGLQPHAAVSRNLAVLREAYKLLTRRDPTEDQVAEALGGVEAAAKWLEAAAKAFTGAVQELRIAAESLNTVPLTADVEGDAEAA